MVKYHPNAKLRDEQIEHRNIACGLLETSDSKIISYNSRAVFHFGVLKLLLPPNEINPKLAEFYCYLYNRRAIARRRVPLGSFLS